MALTAHVFPAWQQACMNGKVDIAGTTPDTLKVGLISAGSAALATAGAAAWDGYTTVASFLTNGTYPLTEVLTTGGTGYTRQALTSVSVNLTGLYTSLVVGTNPSWYASTISAVGAFFYDYTAGGSSDTAGLMIAWWDFAGTNTDSNGVYTLVMPTANAVANVLWQVTAAL